MSTSSGTSENNIKTLWQNNRLLISLLLLYILFYRFWENLIAKYIVDLFLCQVESNDINDIIFISPYLYLLIKLAINVDSKDMDNRITMLSDKKAVITIILFCFWYYYRFLHLGPFSFTPIKNNFIPRLNVCYVDLIVFFDVFHLYLYFGFRVLYPKTSSDYNIEKHNGFIPDIPISNKEKDKLNVNIFAEKAVDELISTNTHNNSFSYGIISPWGSGKTSFMNLMKSYVISNYNDCIVVDYNPWLYSKDNDIITSFFDELSKRIRNESNFLSDLFIDYSKALSNANYPEGKIIHFMINMFLPKSTIEDKSNKIRKWIRINGKKIIVFIDDIDRLDSEELVEVLKLIRNISDFPNMYFVAAYDKTYILECLKSKIASKSIDFSEKIFQVETYLPSCSYNTLRRQLFQNLIIIKSNITLSPKELKEKGINDEMIADLKQLKNYILGNGEKCFPISAVSNIRDVNRISNDFNSTYHLIRERNNKTILNVCDLLLLKVLKAKYPLVYTLFEKKRDDILISKDNKYYILYNQYEGKDGFDLLHYIWDNRDELHLRINDCEIIVRLLSLLFPYDVSEKKSFSKAINQITYCDRYFSINFEKHLILDNSFKYFIINDLKYIQHIIKCWNDNELLCFEQFLQDYEPSYTEELNKQIELIFMVLDSLPSQKLNEEYYNNWYHTIQNMKAFPFGSGSYSNQDMKRIKQLIGESYNRRKCEILSKLYDERSLDFPLDKKAISAILKNIFSNYVKTAEPNIGDLILCYNFALKANPNNNKMKQDIKIYALNHILDFIPYLITLKRKRHYGSSSFYYLNAVYNSLWKNKEEFEKSLNKQDKEEAIVKEFLNFLNDYDQTHDKTKGTLFSFIHIIPKGKTESFS